MDIVSGRDIVGAADELLDAIISGGDDGIEGEVGYDARAIVGAIQQAALRRAANLRKSGGGGAHSARPTEWNGKKLDPTKWRRLPAAIPQQTIAAGATADVTIKPQRLFRPEFLIASETTAGKMFIDGAFVQGENQFVTSGSIPVSTFYGTVLLNNEMQLKTADIGAEVTLKVRNSDTAVGTFSGTFFGEAYID